MKYDSTLEADLFTQAINSVPHEWENCDQEIAGPILFLFDGSTWSSSGFVVESQLSPAKGKDRIAAIARQIIAEQKPLASVFLTQSTGVGATEMVIASVETSTTSCVAIWDIIREGMNAKLGPVSIVNGDSVGGRFANLFQRPAKVQLDA
jgi:hypothetical protein